MIYDLLGIGFGPSNLSLAIALEEAGYQGTYLFLERQKRPAWHEQMLLDGSDIQNNPLRDLITPVNPRSQYTFVNYLHNSGRFFDYLNLGIIYPFRREFNNYFTWVAEQFDCVRYGVSVDGVEFEWSDEQGGVWKVALDSGEILLCRHLIVGTGRKLNIPQIDGLKASSRVVHLVNYLSSLEGLPEDASIAVLGSSQSAVEILLDLRDKGFNNITSIHRSFSFRLKDTSPFSDKVYFPEFVDYYHALPPEKRALLDNQVRATNYSSADRDVIDELYRCMYRDQLEGKQVLEILNNHTITSVTDGSLEVEEVYSGERNQRPFDLLILATGFLDIGRNGRDGLPELLSPLADLFVWQQEYLNVNRDYTVECQFDSQIGNGHSQPEEPRIYLNGLCESSHGLGDAGSFSLLALRARDICNSVMRTTS